jgi:YaiO family outer membrane protein
MFQSMPYPMNVFELNNMVNIYLSKTLQILAKIFLCLLLPFSLKAQYVDSNYINAKALAYKGKFDTAITLLKASLDENPYDLNVQMMLGRVYAWGKKYPESEALLKAILEQKPQSREALNVLADVYLWSKKYDELEKLVKKALNPANTDDEEGSVKDSVSFIQKQVYAYMDEKRYDEAKKILLPVKDKLPKLWDALGKKLLSNTLSLHYSYFDFQNQSSDWHTFSAEYTRQLRGITFVASLNNAQRFGTSGNQYMLQAYPKLSRKMYAWLIAGFSNGKAFPNGVYGLSLFRSVKRYWEPELGIRIFTITKNNERSTVLRGGLSYQKGHNRFNYIASRIDGATTNGWAHFGSFRRYLNDDQSYMQLSLGTGATESTTISTTFDNFIISSFATSLNGIYWFNNHWRGDIGISYEQSERSNSFEYRRSRITYSIGTAYRF